MPATLAAARGGGDHRRVGRRPAELSSASTARRPGSATPPPRRPTTALTALRDRVEGVSAALGRRIKILVGKPGLDGHSNGAEQIAVRARDAGMDVVYEGIRLTPARIARTAVDEGVHVVGLSILSGSHAELIPAVLAELREAGADVPVVVGGIIPPADEAALLEAGVARVYTPKDFEVSRIMGDIVDLVAEPTTAWRPPAVRLERPAPMATDPAELGRRLRERDRSAAPAALNVIENRADRDATRRAARARSRPARSAARRRRTSSASRGRPGRASRRCCRRSWRSGAGEEGPWRCSRSTLVEALRRLAARRPRAHRPRPARRRHPDPLDRRRRAGSAGSPRPPARRPRRSRRPSTSWWSRLWASASRRPTSRTCATPSPWWCSRPRATCSSS